MHYLRAFRWRGGMGFLLLLLLLALLSWHRWVQWSGEPAPPGSDGGNWLAFSQELLGGSVKAARSVYPPMFPALLRLALLFLPPLVALKWLALMASASVALPGYLLLRTTLPPWASAFLASALPGTDYSVEILAWGGYPQLLGTAFLLMALYTFLRALHARRARAVFVSLVWGVLALGTQTLVAFLLLMVLGVALLVYLYGQGGFFPLRAPGRRPPLLPALAGAGCLMVLGLGSLFLYLTMARLMAGSPVNPQGFSLLEFFRNILSWRTEHYMWLAVVGAVLVPGWALVTRRGLLLAEAIAAILVPSVLGMALLGEMRLAHLIQVGLLLSVGLALAEAIRVASRRRGLPALATWMAALALAGAFLGGVGFFGEQRAKVAFDWYRVVDSDALEALQWLRSYGTGDGLVVANATVNGGIYGWWVEGYARLPTYMAVDTRWLFFREEKAHARIARRLLDPDTSPEEVRRLAQVHDVRYLMLDKGTLARPLAELRQAGFQVVLENEKMVVLRRDEGQP